MLADTGLRIAVVEELTSPCEHRCRHHHRPRRDGRPGRRRSNPPHCRRSTGSLRHLYIGFDGRAKGGADRAPQHRQPDPRGTGAIPFDPNDCWLETHSPSFDVAVWEIFGSLATGGRLRDRRRRDVRDPPDLCASPRRSGQPSSTRHRLHSSSSPLLSAPTHFPSR